LPGSGAWTTAREAPNGGGDEGQPLQLLPSSYRKPWRPSGRRGDPLQPGASLRVSERGAADDARARSRTRCSRASNESPCDARRSSQPVVSAASSRIRRSSRARQARDHGGGGRCAASRCRCGRRRTRRAAASGRRASARSTPPVGTQVALTAIPARQPGSVRARQAGTVPGGRASGTCVHARRRAKGSDGPTKTSWSTERRWNGRVWLVSKNQILSGI
jgi:hypothetical protein